MHDDRYNDDDGHDGQHLQVEVRCLSSPNEFGEGAADDRGGGGPLGDCPLGGSLDGDLDGRRNGGRNGDAGGAVLCSAGATADMDGYHSLERDWGIIRGRCLT